MPMLRTARGVQGVGARGHDWLEVTALPALEPAPVDELVAPELPELVDVVEVPAPVAVVASSELPEPAVSPVAVVVPVSAATLTVVVLRASAGSWPVISTTAINDHTARNRATDPPTTRERIIRTRAWRACRILIPSSLVMTKRIGPRRSNTVSAA